MRSGRPHLAARGRRLVDRLVPLRAGARLVFSGTAAQRQAAGDPARQAAVLFVASGLIGLANDLMPSGIGYGHPIAYLLDSVNLSIGLVAARLPWRRWHHRAPLVLALAALANLAANRIAGVLPEPTFGVWFVLVFVWIGLWYPPPTSLAMAPFAAAAYALPFAFRSADGGVTTVAIAIPIAALVGETISRQAAAARRAQTGQREALDALARASVTDDLTGLGNRRRANELLDDLADDDALVILDIDHFKVVNDTLGHHRGDQVLMEFGAFLRQAVRQGDAAARYGGEEFIVVLRRAGAGAMHAVERLLGAWRATDPPVAVSAGVAVKAPGQSWSATFSNADAALYEAKASGRDRAVLYQPDLRAAKDDGPRSTSAVA